MTRTRSRKVIAGPEGGLNMSVTIQRVTVTNELLQTLQFKALLNASMLIGEAEILFSAKRHARSYFLAAAAIEEIGKAALAFIARGRNLSDHAIQTRLATELGSHSAKISCAFVASIKTMSPEQVRGWLEEFTSLCSGLRRGREAALYSDVTEDGEIRSPDQIVTDTNAHDCIRLAKTLIANTTQMVSDTSPQKFTAVQDRHYALGKKVLQVWQNPDFGDHLLMHLETSAHEFDLFAATVEFYAESQLAKRKP